VADSTRPSAQVIYERVLDDARDEIERRNDRLAFSGVFAGLAMGLTAIGVATALAVLPPGGSSDALAKLLYPVGFLAVVLGRAQLFTENTLYPVVLTLSQRRYLGATARLWAIVFAANLLGVLLFALLAAETSALTVPIRDELVKLGAEAQAGGFGHTFWSGVIGGWLIALMAWLVAAGDHVAGQFLVVYVFAFVVGLGGFDHCIASAGEVLAATFDGRVGFGAFLEWLAPTTLGNVAGGVVIVSMLNFGQVAARRG
jgi:formate-nitrite transporter family protein